ncbi:hypothetical protein NDU88_000831 [Pleurodeles waltl]|uniref:Uncharacterized protein n=1 Tax=Pleurodeles waltl TaxID=8319 RepID=A0AAV7WK21_PLEWA|nr:hypothetical protein NDU88_000831 [Pleurodeles waltl]
MHPARGDHWAVQVAWQWSRLVADPEAVESSWPGPVLCCSSCGRWDGGTLCCLRLRRPDCGRGEAAVLHTSWYVASSSEGPGAVGEAPLTGHGAVPCQAPSHKSAP